MGISTLLCSKGPSCTSQSSKHLQTFALRIVVFLLRRRKFSAREADARAAGLDCAMFGIQFADIVRFFFVRYVQCSSGAFRSLFQSVWLGSSGIQQREARLLSPNKVAKSSVHVLDAPMSLFA